MAKASPPKTTKKTTNRTKQTAPKKETKLNQTFYYDRKKLVYQNPFSGKNGFPRFNFFL